MGVFGPRTSSGLYSREVLLHNTNHHLAEARDEQGEMRA